MKIYVQMFFDFLFGFRLPTKLSQFRAGNMYKSSLTNLLKLTGDGVKKFVDSFDTVLVDCDGVLWLGNDVIGGSPEVINQLKQLGKRVFLVTNNSTKSRNDIIRKVQRMKYMTSKVRMF